jgi:hypothetical protein
MRVFRSGVFLTLALLSAACTQKPASIDISPKKVTIYGLERSQRLTGRILDKKGRALEVGTPSWSSSDPGVVAAEVGGRLVAKKEGRASVRAEYGGVSAEVPVEIVDISAVEIFPPFVSLTGPAGTMYPLSAAIRNSKREPVAMAPTWISLDPKVATVSADGQATSVAAGTTTIVAKVGDLQGASEVRVTLRQIGRLEIRPETALVRVGESQKFQAVAYAPDGTPIPDIAAVFRSTNPAVASVDASGTASGLSTGSTTIRAELGAAAAEAALLVN